jgi:hypothetical protein
VHGAIFGEFIDVEHFVEDGEGFDVSGSGAEALGLVVHFQAEHSGDEAFEDSELGAGQIAQVAHLAGAEGSRIELEPKDAANNLQFVEFNGLLTDKTPREPDK